MMSHPQGENTPIAIRRSKKFASESRSRLQEKISSKAARVKKSLSKVHHHEKEAPFRSIENLMENDDLMMTPMKSEKPQTHNTYSSSRSTTHSSSTKQRQPNRRRLSKMISEQDSDCSSDEIGSDAESVMSESERAISFENRGSLKTLLNYECENSLSDKQENSLRKRKRKSPEQLNFLAVEFEKNPYWSKEKTMMLAEKTGLSEAQVYKWSWDQRRKRFGPDAAMKKYEDFTGLCSQNSSSSTAAGSTAMGAAATVGTSTGVKRYKEDGNGGFIVTSEDTSAFKTASAANRANFCDLDAAASFAESFSNRHRRETKKTIPGFRCDEEVDMLADNPYNGIEDFQISRNGVEGVLFCDEQYRPSQFEFNLGELSQSYRKSLNETLYGSSVKVFDLEPTQQETSKVFDDDFEALLPSMGDDHIRTSIQTPVKDSLEHEISCFMPENDSFKLQLSDILRA